jgi:hypothetical protein
MDPPQTPHVAVRLPVREPRSRKISSSVSILSSSEDFHAMKRRRKKVGSQVGFSILGKTRFVSVMGHEDFDGLWGSFQMTKFGRG